jgi:hypothetical protein
MFRMSGTLKKFAIASCVFYIIHYLGAAAACLYCLIVPIRQTFRYQTECICISFCISVGIAWAALSGLKGISKGTECRLAAIRRIAGIYFVTLCLGIGSTLRHFLDVLLEAEPSFKIKIGVIVAFHLSLSIVTYVSLVKYSMVLKQRALPL